MSGHQEDEYTINSMDGFVDEPLEEEDKHVNEKKKEEMDKSMFAHEEDEEIFVDEPTMEGEEEHGNDGMTSGRAVQKYSGRSDESDTEEDGHIFRLSEDSYSILFVAKLNSKPFWCAIGVLFIQVLVLGLAVYDMARQNSGHLFYPPINVSLAVAITQYVSLVVAGLTQVDVFISLEALTVVDYIQSVTVNYPGATKTKWILSNGLRLMVGVCTLFAIFLIIAMADNVMSIFKDFAALHFITEFDNIAFWLANFGYFGRSVKRAAKNTQLIEFPRANISRQWLSWITITVIMVLLFSGLTYIRIRQIRGDYLIMRSAKSLTVHFGDEIYDFDKNNTFDFASTSRNLARFNETAPPVFHYAYFSGSYKINLHALDKHDGRPIYYERGGKECPNDPTCGRFYYCQNVRAWVFTVRALNDALQEKDKCKWGWLAQSAETEAFKLEDVPAMGWKIWTRVMTDTEALTITNDECRQKSDCRLHGTCGTDGECSCFEGWQGKKCDVEVPYLD